MHNFCLIIVYSQYHTQVENGRVIDKKVGCERGMIYVYENALTCTNRECYTRDMEVVSPPFDFKEH